MAPRQASPERGTAGPTPAASAGAAAAAVPGKAGVFLSHVLLTGRGYP